MRSRITAILVIALFLSGGATYLVYRVLATSARADAVPTSQLVSAVHELQTGAVIKDADVKGSPWSGAPPKGALAKKEDVVGRGVVAPIYEGEVIAQARLAAPGAGGGLASMIPAGMRAV